MINIAVSTSTRAEYGLMRPLIFKLAKDEDFEMSLLVTGTHLSPLFGMTIHEIESDNIPISVKIDILEEDNGIVNVANTFSNAVSRFTKYFTTHSFDCLLVDGDRYETLAIVIAAVISNIAVVHCGGGETTEGANDEYWRHAITKLSSIHFPTLEVYRKRILQMGENPSNVITVGSMGLDNIVNMQIVSLPEIEKYIGFKLDKPFALVTFHPVTMEPNLAKAQISELLRACSNISDMKFIFTMANADAEGMFINDCISQYVSCHKDSSICVSSLGACLYLSTMKYCEFVLGNSSSGIIEAPSFGIPTVNVGNRQKGRVRALSIIDCDNNYDSILKAISMARNKDFQSKCRNVINPNGDGKASERIIAELKRIFNSGVDVRTKHFFSTNISMV